MMHGPHHLPGKNAGLVDPMLTVLGRISSINVRKVLWLCEELQIEFKHEDWGTPARPTSDPEFVALNPNAQVPVMIDGDGVLWESNTICRYLASLHKRADLLSEQPLERARIEQWMDWQATDLNTAWRYPYMALVKGTPANPDANEVAAGVSRWNKTMQILDGQLKKTGAYVAGVDFTLADIGIGLSTHRWLLSPIERPDLPAVRAHYERLKERSGFQRYASKDMP